MIKKNLFKINICALQNLIKGWFDNWNIAEILLTTIIFLNILFNFVIPPLPLINILSFCLCVFSYKQNLLPPNKMLNCHLCFIPIKNILCLWSVSCHFWRVCKDITYACIIFKQIRSSRVTFYTKIKLNKKINK